MMLHHETCPLFLPVRLWLKRLEIKIKVQRELRYQIFVVVVNYWNPNKIFDLPFCRGILNYVDFLRSLLELLIILSEFFFVIFLLFLNLTPEVTGNRDLIFFLFFNRKYENFRKIKNSINVLLLRMIHDSSQLS